MASLQERNGSYRVLFCHHGKLHAFTIGKVERDEAENKARQVDYLLMRLKQRLLVLPEGNQPLKLARLPIPPLRPGWPPLAYGDRRLNQASFTSRQNRPSETEEGTRDQGQGVKGKGP